MIRLLSSGVFKSKSNIRYFPSKKLSDKPQNVTVKDTTSSSHSFSDISQKFHIPNKLERTILVWTGMYKSKADIPKRVTIEAVEKARNKARIKVANYMMLATAIACIFVAISGRRAAERGESVSKMNLEWHRQIKEEAEKAQK